MSHVASNLEALPPRQASAVRAGIVVAALALLAAVGWLAFHHP